MSKKRKISIRIKFALISVNLILAILMLVFTLVGFLLTKQNETFLADTALKDTKKLLNYFSDTIYEGILFDDDILISKSFDNIKNLENIDYAVLFDADKKVKLHSELFSQQTFHTKNNKFVKALFKRKEMTVFPPFDPENIESAYMISKSYFDNNDNHLGMLLVEYSATEIKARTEEIRDMVLNALLIAGIFSLLMAVGFALVLARLIVRPIQKMVKGTQLIAEGDLNHQIEVNRNDELGTLAEDFNLMTRRIKNTLDHLEDLVGERTQDLQTTLTEVQDLKIKQDGDYFLTSLILKPLIQNNVSSTSVSVDMLLKQKTSFEFRNRMAELGGDICIADNLTISKKKYVIFTNGDAMGKSVQGAGGALIYGIVFHTILTQIKEGLYGTDLTPEGLMPKIFEEMQKAFTPFDGSMLMSGVIGLIDEKTGKVWYFNAEHPYLVLYRGKKASFVESDMELHKFGIFLNEMKMPIEVKTFQMRDGDSIFLGSDGRDDIALGEETEENRRINDDEHMFLRWVERGNGELSQIQTKLEDWGDLTDDLSLLKLTYRKI